MHGALELQYELTAGEMGKRLTRLLFNHEKRFRTQRTADRETVPRRQTPCTVTPGTQARTHDPTSISMTYTAPEYLSKQLQLQLAE